MFKTTSNFFKVMGSFLNSLANSAKQASEALENSADAMLKRSEINRDKAFEDYKKRRAQMVKDGGYESEEAMDREIKKLYDEIFK